MKRVFIAVFLLGLAEHAAAQTIPPGQAPMAPPDDPVQDVMNAFNTSNGAQGYVVKELNSLFKAYQSLKMENDRLRAENAKLTKAAPAPAPSTPTPAPAGGPQ